MKRILATTLAAAVLFFTATFAGLAVFGMETTMPMDMDHGACAGAHCESHNDGAAADCVATCLAAVPKAGPSAAVALPLLVAFALARVFLGDVTHSGAAAATRGRWRDGIPIFRRNEELATVILRN